MFLYSIHEYLHGFPIPHILMFVSMVAIQVFVMPYVMTENTGDVYFSVSQGYMGAFMGACMVLIEALMHPIPWWAVLFTIGLAVVAALGFRYQWFVSDDEYLHDMIPHHSMAIVTSAPRLRSADPFVRRLAQQISLNQTKEIITMKQQLRERERGLPGH